MKWALIFTVPILKHKNQTNLKRIKIKLDRKYEMHYKITNNKIINTAQPQHLREQYPIITVMVQLFAHSDPHIGK